MSRRRVVDNKADDEHSRYKLHTDGAGTKTSNNASAVLRQVNEEEDNTNNNINSEQEPLSPPSQNPNNNDIFRDEPEGDEGNDEEEDEEDEEGEEDMEGIDGDVSPTPAEEGKVKKESSTMSAKARMKREKDKKLIFEAHEDHLMMTYAKSWQREQKKKGNDSSHETYQLVRAYIDALDDGDADAFVPLTKKLKQLQRGKVCTIYQPCICAAARAKPWTCDSVADSHHQGDGARSHQAKGVRKVRGRGDHGVPSRHRPPRQAAPSGGRFEGRGCGVHTGRGRRFRSVT